MSARIKRLAAAAVSCVALAPFAGAQIANSGPLGGVNPWGVGWIGSTENALPTDFWGDSRKTDLTPLFQSITPDRLSPAELNLLTRVLMSSSKAPEGDSDEMILQRVRLLKILGAEDKVVDLYRRFPNADWARPVAEIEVDQDLTAGDNNRACRQVASVTDVEDFWLKARIACLVIAGQVQDAQLAADLARSDGLDDPWLFSVVFSLGEDSEAHAPAKFDTGVQTAISLQADLLPPINALTTVSPYRAAKIAQRQDVADDLRVMAIQRAAIAGGLSREDERAALVPERSLSEEVDPETGETVIIEDAGMPTPLEHAVDVVAAPEASMVEKAEALVQALAAAQTDPRTFKLHARVLTDELRSIPIEYDTISYAPTFIRALISAGEIRSASSWRAAMDVDQRPQPEPPPPPNTEVEGPVILDPEAALALTDAPDAEGGGPIVLAPEAAVAPTETPDTAPVPEPTPAPDPTPELEEITFSDETKAHLDALFILAGAAKPLNDAQTTAVGLTQGLKKREAERLLYLIGGLGDALPAESRQWLAAERRSNPSSPTPVAEAAMQMQIASDSGAIGEAMMHAIHVLRMDREGQRDAISVARALKVLRQHGQTDIAREAALEAAGVWRLN